MLWIQQARCCHDIHLIRSKTLHRVPGMDMILWTNFIIITPLTSGCYTSDEFGSSHTRWSLTSFVPSFPFYPPPLLPPAITLWICLHHILQTAMSKLCPHSNLTAVMWLHWHKVWANNPSWEGLYSVNSMGRMSVHLSIQYQHAQRVICAGNHCTGLESSPSFFLFTQTFSHALWRDLVLAFIIPQSAKCFWVVQRITVFITVTCWYRALQ